MSAIRLASIAIYPVKSCRGISLERATVEARGIAGDRRWMIVDDAGVFVTQREEPRLALVRVALDRDRLTLEAPGMGALEVDADLASTEPSVEVRIWRTVVRARVHGDASAWFTAYLGRAVRFVSMPEATRRPVNPAYAAPGDVVSFADGYPLLVASRSSLDDLNARLEVPVGMERFRPNVVIEGAGAWDEDRWVGLRIGALTFRAPKPCARCVITTIDPESAIAAREPLRTLATFRKQADGVMFGVNLIPDLADGATTELAIGDPVEPIERS